MGKIISCNSKFVAIWGYPLELLERRDRRELMVYAATQVKDSQEFLRRIEQHQSAPEIEAFDVVEMKDGRTFERYPFPQRINGQCVGVVVNYRGITEHKRSEEGLARFAAIVDSSDDAIISKTLGGIITSWNRSATRLFGYEEDEMIGQSILKLIPPHLQTEEPMILARLQKGERIEHFETVRVRKDGVTLSPVRGRDGTIIGVSKIARDITERKQAEAEREELLNREKIARGEAEAANRAKDEFLAVVSRTEDAVEFYARLGRTADDGRREWGKYSTVTFQHSSQCAGAGATDRRSARCLAHHHRQDASGYACRRN